MKLNVLKITVLALVSFFAFYGIAAANPAQAQQYMAQGVKLIKAKQYDKAIQYLNQSIKLRPTANAYAYLGFAYNAKGDKANAVRNAQQALKMDPNNQIAKKLSASAGGAAAARPGAAGKEVQYLQMGHKFMKAKNFDQAIRYYNGSIKVKPTAQAYQWLGTAYMNKGNKDMARTAYQNSLKLNPNNPAVKNALAKLGGAPSGTAAEPRLGEQLGVHPLLLAGLFAGAIAVLFLF